MALARLDIPGLVLYGGSIAPGHFRRARTSRSRTSSRRSARIAAGKIDDEDLHELEAAACPGAGACGGQFTANTMALALEFLGLSPGRPERDPGVHPRKAEAARRGRPRS